MRLARLPRGIALVLSFVAAATVACAQVSPPPSARAAVAEAEPLRILQLDVGQGDAALITTPEGRRILIDAGPNGDRTVAALRGAAVDTIDLVIASHAHADHIGGMPLVLARFPVRAYIDNGIPHTTATYQRTLSAVEREPGLRYLDASARSITVGSATLRILPPRRADATQNDNSVGVVVEYGAFRALYTGDAEGPALGAWVAAGRIPRVTVVKVPHHGSRNGTTADLVRATSPAVAVISVGARNAYDHPAASVEATWRAATAAIYRTDRDGTIEIAAHRDGTFTVRTSVRPDARFR